ncbi:MAG: type III pantothenate kinase [Candidatus Marithrix sp.]
MILLVDIGNTAIKWAILENNNLGIQQYIAYEASGLDYTLAKIWKSIDKPEAIWISNVAGTQINESITAWTTKYWQCQPNFTKTTKYKCGVKNGYKYPEQLGIDRWLALIGVYSLKIEMSCIVDCGTAVTIDILDNGQHLGGIIAPGLNAMQTALFENTYKLTSSKQILTTCNFSLANDTSNGIVFGTLYAVLGLLEYVMNSLENKPKLILTGGDVAVLKPFLSRTYQYIPDLVLQGLKTIINHEKSSSITVPSEY